MPPCPERLFGVLLDFRYALPERYKPRMRRLGKPLVRALLVEFGLHQSWEESQVFRLVLEVE
jgi:hypothetical protein